MNKLREDVEKLKAEWLRDPNWDIEETEGFDDYRDELRTFRENIEAEADKKANEKMERRLDVICTKAGTDNRDLALYIYDLERQIEALRRDMMLMGPIALCEQ